MTIRPRPTVARPGGVPTRAGWRLVRATVLGAASLGLAGAAHLLGGGELPDPAVLLFLTVVVGTVAVLVTARRCTFPLLLAVLGGEQLALHTLFGTLAAGGPMAMPAGVGMLPGQAPATSPLGHTLVDAAAGGHYGGGAMLAAHVLATVLTALLLLHGEDLLWWLGSAAVAAAGAAPTARLRTSRAARPVTVVAAAGRLVTGDAAPRGPPVAAAQH